jgi:murein endopeptidase
MFVTTHTASKFGGEERIEATVVGVTGAADLDVRVAGLVAMPAGANYDHLYRALPPHEDSRWATPTMVQGLVAIADAYAAAYPGSILWYNDMSLPKGGLFDLNSNWNTPHSEHRLGGNTDVSPLNVSSD